MLVLCPSYQVNLSNAVTKRGTSNVVALFETVRNDINIELTWSGQLDGSRPARSTSRRMRRIDMN